MYPEYMPQEIEILPDEEQPLPAAAASPTEIHKDMVPELIRRGSAEEDAGGSRRGSSFNHLVFLQTKSAFNFYFYGTYTLPSNTITNPKVVEARAITTRKRTSYSRFHQFTTLYDVNEILMEKETGGDKDKVLPSTKDIPTPVFKVLKIPV
ncbi:hypothetical protein Tco_0950754 [Tanacetum coccineum]